MVASRDPLTDPAETVERTFAVATARSRSGSLLAAVSRSANILAPYRRVEPALIPGWYEGVVELHDALRAERNAVSALRAFVHRRVAVAADFADALLQTPSF